MTRSFKIYDYHIDPATSSVKLFNRDFRLEPKVMNVLCLLAQEPGKVYSKSEILEHVWPNQIVDPELVTRAIFELRKLFCDDPKQPKYIKTIPRKGYVLLPEVEYSVTSTLNKKINFKPIYTAIFLTVCSLLVASLYLIKSIQQPENYEEKLTYSRSDSIYDLVQDPSNQFSAFIAGEPKKQHIYKKDALSGQVVQLTHDAGSYHGLDFLNNQLTSVRCAQECELIQLKGGQWLPLKKFKYPVSDFTVSPDNLYLALAIRIKGSKQIVLTNVDNKENEFEFVGLGTNAWQPAFISNETLIYIASNEQDKIKLVTFDLNTDKKTFLDIPLTRISALTHIKENQIAITGKTNKQYGVWLYDLETNDFNLLKSLKPSDTVRDMSVGLHNLILNIQSRRIDIWSQGSKALHVKHPSIDFNASISSSFNSLYFASNRTGSYELWTSSSSGSTRLSDVAADLIDKVLPSHSENMIAFTMQSQQQKFLVLYSITDAKITIKIEIPHASNLIGWSEFDDELFFSKKSAESYDLLSFKLSEQKLKTVALDAGYIATRDRNGLLYYDLSSRTLMLYGVNGQKNALMSLSDLNLKSLPSCLKLDNKDLYFCERNRDTQIVYSMNISTKEKKRLGEVPRNAFVSDILGSTIVYDMQTQGNSSLSEIKLL
jgi:DNA-binding winged helix-turn-helix (wHTH) protein